MSQPFITFFGFSSFLAWLQVGESLCLARDATVHNGSPTACTAFALTLLAYGLASRFAGFRLSRSSRLCVAIAAAVFGFVYALCPNEVIRLTFFCLQMICGALLAVSWAVHLASFDYRTLLPGICGAGVLSATILFVCSEFSTLLAPLAIAILPGCAGICLFFAEQTHKRESIGQERIGPLSEQQIHQPISSPLAKLIPSSVPWVLVVALCLCTFLSSLFSGLATNPYLINSHTVSSYTLGVSTVALAAIGIGSWLFNHRRNRIPKRIGGSEELPSPEQLPAEKAGTHHEATTPLQVSIGGVLVILVGGLLLFSMQPPGTMTAALGLVLGAKNCLVALCWIVFCRIAVESEFPIVPGIVALMLASGMFYAEYLGAWINKLLQIGFGTLTGLATALIALVALIAILFMIMRIRQLGSEQTDLSNSTESAAPEPLTLEDIRSALRDHQLAIMEPYGLTEREREIVLMIVDGQTMGSIAEQLFITERTVKFHSKNAYDKLGVHSRKELMQMFSEL